MVVLNDGAADASPLPALWQRQVLALPFAYFPLFPLLTEPSAPFKLATKIASWQFYWSPCN